MKDKFIRDFEVEDVVIENDKITFSVASSTPYERTDNKHGTYFEVLTISSDAIDFTRLVDGRCPFLYEHDTDRQIGVVERAYIENGKLYVDVKFSTNFEAQEVVNDIKAGIRRNTSIGYIVDDYVMQNTVGEAYPTMIVTRWTPYECSTVSTPADPTVGYQRSLELKKKDIPMKRNIKSKKNLEFVDEIVKKIKDLFTDDENAESEAVEATAEAAEEAKEEVEETKEEATEEIAETEVVEDQAEEKSEEQPEAPAETTEEEKDCGEEIEKKEVCPNCGKEPCECEEEEIRSLGDLLNKKSLAAEFIKNKRSLKEFKDAVRTNTKKEVKSMTKKFSLRKALLNATGKMSDEEASFEREVIAENKRKFGVTDADIVVSRRDFNGSEALNQVQYQPGMYTPNLRPPVTVDAIGTKKVSVAGPSISFSVCTSGINAGYVDLNNEIPSATMDFALKTMTPHKVGAYVDVSYQSLLQDDPSAEGIIMDDIVKALDQARDDAFWNGLAANNEPVGVLNASDVNTVTVPATPTLSTALEFEKKIRESYDYSANLKWVFGTNAYYKWASTPYSATEQNKMLLDPDDRKCIGYDCYIDPNLPASAVVLGNFDEALDAAFDGITIKIVEDAALARKQALEIVAYAANDYLLRRPKSFTKSI